MAIKVSLRYKPIKNEKSSLYLDFYPSIINSKTGKLTRRQFLGMYVISKPKNKLEKNQNNETIILAEAIRARRENELSKPDIYNSFEIEQLRLKELGKTDLIEYFKGLTKKREGSSKDIWNSAMAYLNKFLKSTSRSIISFENIDLKLCNDFKDFLLSTTSIKSEKSQLHQNSAAIYFNKFKAVLREAYIEDIIKIDLNKKVQNIKVVETPREVLTIEELNSLIQTPCLSESLKIAALFSALTSLRISDNINLTWNKIEFIKNEGYIIKFKQKKSLGSEVLPISLQAYNILGEPGNGNEKVFKDLKTAPYHSRYLLKWLTDAGISKKITFHNFRHTYATLQLSNNTNIMTISKMMGHRNVKTTQIYAKVVDQSKRAAVDKIILDFNKSS